MLVDRILGEGFKNDLHVHDSDRTAMGSMLVQILRMLFRLPRSALVRLYSAKGAVRL